MAQHIDHLPCWLCGSWSPLLRGWAAHSAALSRHFWSLVIFFKLAASCFLNSPGGGSHIFIFYYHCYNFSGFFTAGEVGGLLLASSHLQVRGVIHNIKWKKTNKVWLLKLIKTTLLMGRFICHIKSFSHREDSFMKPSAALLELYPVWEGEKITMETMMMS